MKHVLESSTAEKKKLYSKLSSQMGEAVCDFKMLAPDDRVLVAVSGGKDSLTLLKLLSDRKRLTPFHYDLIAIHVDMNVGCGISESSAVLKNFLDQWQIPLEVMPLEVEMKFDPEKMGSSCFWCSWNRRKVFFEAAKRLGCTKVALGHHKDDLVETTLMNLFYQGNFTTMLPRQSYFKGEFEMIRPLSYIEEKDIIQFAIDLGFPDQTCRCPVGQASHRQKIKNLLKSLSKENNSIKSNIAQATLRKLRAVNSE